MARLPAKGVESARAEFPRLLDEAERGRSTLITRHGRVVAAIGPPSPAKESRQLPLAPMAGSGRGLWGRDSGAAVRQMRDEWSR